MAIETYEDFADSIRSRVLKEGLHTALPCTVTAVEFDSERGLLVSVQPDVAMPFTADTGLDDVEAEPTEYVLGPVLTEVPVAFTGAGEYTHTVPIKAGTTGFLLCMEASIDEWLITNGEAQPADPRRFALQDAVFLPQLRRFGAASSVEYDADVAVLSGPVHKFGGASAARTLARAKETAEELADLYARVESLFTATNAAFAAATAAFLPSGGPALPTPALGLWATLPPVGLLPATTADIEATNILVEE